MSRVFADRLRQSFQGLLYALAMSLLTVALSTALVFGLGLLIEKDVHWDHDYISIKDCIIGQGRRAISAFWFQPAWGPIHPTKLGFHDVGAEIPLRVPWPEMQPTCLRPLERPEALLVGTLHGGIYAASTSAPEQSPALIAQQSDGEVMALDASGDERWLVSVGPRHVHGWDLARRSIAWRIDDIEANAVAVNGPANRVYAGLRDGRVVGMNLHTGQVVETLARMDYAVRQVALSPDGQLLVALGAAGCILMIEPQTGETRWEVGGSANHAGGMRVARFSPGGDLLVTVTIDNVRNLTIWETASGRQLGTLVGHQGAVLGARFAQGGKLYSWGTDGTVRHWDVERQTALAVTALSLPAQG